jgi:thioredoxin-related protein
MMQVAKIKSVLEIVTNVAVVLVAIILLCFISWNYFDRQTIPIIKNGLQKGKTVDEFKQFNLKNSNQTLIIAINSNCNFCIESVPFYSQLLSKQQDKHDINTQIIAIFPNSESEAQQFLQNNHLKINFVHSANFQLFGINGTPTLLLVDSSGKIMDFWIGKLQESDKQQVVMALFGGQN